MPSGPKSSWRILIALLVYNGEEFVGPCLSSLARLKPGTHSVDILVLDDASPALGWSDRCREMANANGFGYYRTPRNLGIPRNMNLGMLRAMDAGYDAVVLLNADTIVPADMVPTLIRPLLEDPSISCATAWSNSASVYSIPNEDPDRLADTPELIDWLSERLNEEFGNEVIPIPSGVGFCLAMSTSVINDVGLMDPVFGRGYSEEIDWSLRSHSRGYRSVLVPSCFVYHAGSGITKAEGIIGESERVLQAHETIVNERYPFYRSQVTALLASSIIDGMCERGLGRIVVSAARQHGYRLETSRLHQSPSNADVVRFRIELAGTDLLITGSFEGFEASFAVGADGVLSTVQAIVGRLPQEIRIFDRGPLSDEIESAAVTSTTPVRRAPYPERVL
jgi:GT2 family glycosyltransferase